MNNTMNRSDWMARADAATQAANRWAFTASQHEAEAGQNPWAKAGMTAMAARDHEARCRSAAAHARDMACDVR